MSMRAAPSRRSGLAARAALLQDSPMKFAQTDSSDGILVRGYEAGAILIGERRFHNSLLLTPRKIIPDWPVTSAADLEPAHFEAVLALEPELIILGTGASQVFPGPEIYAAVMGAGIGIEIMDTGAGCRTYNILMSEGRRVAAALIV